LSQDTVLGALRSGSMVFLKEGSVKIHLFRALRRVRAEAGRLT
jgi:hypothetical protein